MNTGVVDTDVHGLNIKCWGFIVLHTIYCFLPFYFFFTDSGTGYEESVEMVDTFLEKAHWNVSGEID